MSENIITEPLDISETFKPLDLSKQILGELLEETKNEKVISLLTVFFNYKGRNINNADRENLKFILDNIDDNAVKIRKFAKHHMSDGVLGFLRL